MEQDNVKYALVGSVVLAILMIAIGYYLLRVVRSDEDTHSCDADWWVKGIAWLVIIVNALHLCVSGYMLYGME